MIRNKERGEDEIDFPAKGTDSCKDSDYGTSALLRDSQCACTAESKEGGL